MSAIYFRRWTRMFAHPAAKYFKQYDVLQKGFEEYQHLFNQENPYPQNKWYIRRSVVDREKEINDKLIKNLFLKYPDLKYESINRQKYQGDDYNSYSYSYAFITQQKKLMKAGYTMKKAFEIVEGKFQDKMKRKLDQTLVSRGLAIGNRARSLFTFYQQQVEEESRLKMLRTKRQVKKYEQKLEEIEKALNKPRDGEEVTQSQQYERIFQKITNEPKEQLNKQTKTQKRPELIRRLDGDFKNMFSQFYETASYRDRLRGLTEQEIKEQISTSPNKIKKLSRELISYLKSKGGVSIDSNGNLRMSDEISENLRSFINSSPTIKIALFNDLLGYESPMHSVRTAMEQEAKNKLSTLKEVRVAPISPEKKDAIKQNKLKQLNRIIETEFPQDARSYRLLESAEQRMLRLQIRYLSSFIKKEGVDENTLDRMQNAIEDFRRLKFRMEKRHIDYVNEELAYPEHFAFGRHPSDIEETNIEYEDLLEYLRKKTEDRRLRALDQVNDNKINEKIQKQAYPEVPIPEGVSKSKN